MSVPSAVGVLFSAQRVEVVGRVVGGQRVGWRGMRGVPRSLNPSCSPIWETAVGGGQSKVVQPRCHDVARVVGSGHLFTVTWRKLCSPVVMTWREWWMVGACLSLKYIWLEVV